MTSTTMAPAPPRRPDRRHALDAPTRLVLVIIALGLAGRLILAASMGLGVDESYAVSIARQTSLGYFEHPPLSFWLAGALAKLTHGEQRVIVRLPFLLLFAGTTWLMFRLGARLFGEWAGAFAALLLNISPVFSISTGGWVLPDGPLMFCMLASTLCLTHVLIDQPPTIHPTRWWAAAGLLMGLALLSKYHGVFLALGTGLFLLTRADERRWLRHPGPYVGSALAAVVFTPVLLWNARHGWISFRFQASRATSHGGIHPMAMLQTLAGQAGYLFPWIWVPVVYVLVAALVSGPRSRARWFLCCLAIGPIATFTLVALRGNPGLPHWEAPGYLMLFPLLGAAVADRLERGSLITRRWLAASIAAFLLLVALAATDTATGWIARAAPALFRRGDPTLEALDWTDLRRAVASRHLLDRPGVFVAAPDWLQAGKVSYALGPRVPVLCLGGNTHHFQYLHDWRAFVGHDALVLARADRPFDVRTALAPYFAAIVPLGRVPIRRAGHIELYVALYLARALERPPVAPRPR